ncbi:hypothetical protein KY284_005121 [Solanum tuberosum]|nr:hypothetical protein KY284_005121 [Solanum tuberosum]
MHRKGKGLILKHENMREDLADDDHQKKENHNKATSSSVVCYKCDQPGHSIGNCLMYKDDHIEYVKTEEGKDKEGDQVRPKISKREKKLQSVKKDLAAQENSSSDSNDSEHSDDAFMAKSDEEDTDEKVTLSDFKQNLNTFSTCKLRKLVVVLLDLISELTTEKDLMNNSLDISQDGKNALVAQIYDIESQMIVLEVENL